MRGQRTARTLRTMTRATGIPHIDAREAFARARRAQIAARTARWLPGGRRRPSTPKPLDDGASLPSGAPRLRVISLGAVVGTLEPTISFDADFRPAGEPVRARWERIALAHHRGIALPPISVLQRPDGYYVVDGRHRVSVARALGHSDIDAWVTSAHDRRRAAA
jgi:ParB-like nuclease domain